LQDPSQLIIQTLEQVAEKAGDITAQVIENYHVRCPASQQLMTHMDEYMLGRMMDQVVLLLMEDGAEELDNYLRFETSNHRSYGVENYMYGNLLGALRDTVSDLVGNDLQPDELSALDGRIDFLLGKLTAT